MAMLDIFTGGFLLLHREFCRNSDVLSQSEGCDVCLGQMEQQLRHVITVTLKGGRKLEWFQ